MRAIAYQNEHFQHVRHIPNGTAGIAATLNEMAKLARAGRRDPEIRKLAFKIIRHVPARDWDGELGALHSWVRDHIRYVHDPVDTLGASKTRGVEYLAIPRETIIHCAGDCDEHAVVLSSLLGSIGHPSKFVAVGLHGRDFSHVFVESPTAKGNWIPAETTEPVRLGWAPPGISQRLERWAD